MLLLAPEPVQAKLSGPCRRTIELAKVLSDHCEVTLAAPSPSEFPDLPFRVVSTGPAGSDRLNALLAASEVVVTQVLPSPRRLLAVARRSRRLVVDLIAPFAFEALGTDHRTNAARRALVGWRTRELVSHFALADFVLCTNERQRDLVLGMALSANLLLDERLHGGIPAHRRVAVVPNGLPEAGPEPGVPVLRGRGGIGQEDRVAVWGGGIWSWFDPLTPIKAVERLGNRHPEVKLVFLGSLGPSGAGNAAHGERAREAFSYARERGIEGRSVIFHPDWLTHSAYRSALLEADVGVSTNTDSLEAHFSTRTRIVDYLDAGLPIVATRGDPVAQFVEANNFGATVAALDVDGCASALVSVLEGRSRKPDRTALAPLYWKNAASPLVEYCHQPPPPTRRRHLARGVPTARQYGSFARAIYHQGRPADFVLAVARRLFRRRRRS